MSIQKIRYFKNFFIQFYQTSVRLYSAQIVQIQKQNICSTFGKMGKNRRIKGGGSKNSNKCSVFPAAYKLVHLHTNLIFKHSIQNLQNTTKSPFSHHPIQNSNIAPNIVKPKENQHFNTPHNSIPINNLNHFLHI